MQEDKDFQNHFLSFYFISEQRMKSKPSHVNWIIKLQEGLHNSDNGMEARAVKLQVMSEFNI